MTVAATEAEGAPSTAAPESGEGAVLAYAGRSAAEALQRMREMDARHAGGRPARWDAEAVTPPPRARLEVSSSLSHIRALEGEEDSESQSQSQRTLCVLFESQHIVTDSVMAQEANRHRLLLRRQRQRVGKI